jgi:hypothetical protein
MPEFKMAGYKQLHLFMVKRRNCFAWQITYELDVNVEGTYVEVKAFGCRDPHDKSYRF